MSATAIVSLSKAKQTPVCTKSTGPSNKQIQQQKARRDQLILEHLPLVSAIAAHVQKSLPVHIEMDDLIHAGTMGLFARMPSTASAAPFWIVSASKIGHPAISANATGKLKRCVEIWQSDYSGNRTKSKWPTRSA